MAIDFKFTNDDEFLARTIFKWANTWLEPKIDEPFNPNSFPPDFFKNLGDKGFLDCGDIFGCKHFTAK